MSVTGIEKQIFSFFSESVTPFIYCFHLSCVNLFYFRHTEYKYPHLYKDFSHRLNGKVVCLTPVNNYLTLLPMFQDCLLAWFSLWLIGQFFSQELKSLLRLLTIFLSDSWVALFLVRTPLIFLLFWKILQGNSSESF